MNPWWPSGTPSPHTSAARAIPMHRLTSSSPFSWHLKLDLFHDEFVVQFCDRRLLHVSVLLFVILIG